MQQQRNEKWYKTLVALNPQNNSIWRIVKRYKKPYSQLPTLEKGQNKYASLNEIGRIFGEDFQSIFTNDIANNSQQQQIENVVRDFIDNRIFAVNQRDLTKSKEIQDMLRGLHHRKAPGPDEINNILLKNLSKKDIVQLHYIINGIFKTQYYPYSLKIANVILSLKQNKNPKMVESYRPISLHSGISKIIDCVILTRLRLIDDDKQIIPSVQYGFRQGHSTIAQIINISHHAKKAFNSKNSASGPRHGKSFR